MEVATKLKILTHPKKAGIPKMLTALSLAEGLPWIIFSPWNAN
jgi:hypothetical protein